MDQLCIAEAKLCLQNARSSRELQARSSVTIVLPSSADAVAAITKANAAFEAETTGVNGHGMGIAAYSSWQLLLKLVVQDAFTANLGVGDEDEQGAGAMLVVG
jgi:hypothetical protein